MGLITSGAVLPFLGEGLATGGMSFLELYAPVDATTVHMFLFDANCVRGGPSINVELTANDVALLRIDNIGAPAPTSGLVTAAADRRWRVFALPWTGTQAVAARTLWANSNGNFVRVIDPIALHSIDETFLSLTNTGGWNPMRTAAAFFAPLESGGLHTTIYFVCPNTNIQRHLAVQRRRLQPGERLPHHLPGASSSRVQLRRCGFASTTTTRICSAT